MKHPGHRHHEDQGNPWAEATAAEIEIGIGVALILERLNQMAINTDKLLADMTAQTTVLNSLVLFVQGQNSSNADLTKQVADLKAALTAAQVNDPVVQTAVDAIDAIAVSNTALAQGAVPAVTANTPTTPAVAAQVAAAASQPA